MLNSINRTSWLRQAKYGFFLHYLNGAAGCGGGVDNSIDAWNRRTNNFDVEKLAKQLNQLGAGYCFLTLGQNTGFYCTPNQTLQRLLGYSGKDTKLSERDLFMDLADALSQYGIPLMAYTTGAAPVCDDRTLKALGFVPPWEPTKFGINLSHLKEFIDPDPRLKTFWRNWQDVHREWALRYGSKLKGWWVDGCYFNDIMLNFSDEPNCESFAAALRAGNPDALVSFAPGVKYPPIKHSDVEDYTAGEINEPWRGVLNAPSVDGVQYHVLTYAGRTWGAKPLMYSGRELSAITKNIISRGGVISWDVPFSYDNGCFLDDFFEAFLQMREILAKDHAPLVDNTFELLSVPQIDSCGKLKSGEALVSTTAESGAYLKWLDNTIPLKARQPEKIILAAPVTVPKCGIATATIRYGEFEHSYTVPIAQQHCIATPKQFSIYSADGEELGIITIEVRDSVVMVAAKVFDPDHRPNPVVWQGSCVELLFSGDGTSEHLLQTFNTAEGQSLFSQNNQFVPFAPATITAQECSNGYSFNFSMPVSAIPGIKGNSFKFEVHATLTRPPTVVDGVAFGARSIMQDIDRYATRIF